jgi:hypothetical protein
MSTNKSSLVIKQDVIGLFAVEGEEVVGASVGVEVFR